MKLLGQSVIALGVVEFVFRFFPPVNIDILAIILFFAGFSVYGGSRKGAIVALIGCGYLVLAAIVAAIYLAQRSYEIGVWEGSALIFLGIWALLNAIFLARARPIPLNTLGEQINANDVRPVLQFGLRSMFWVMTVIAFMLGFYKWYMQTYAPPPCATVKAIELKYPQQLARLRDVAVGNATNAINDPTNVKLFERDEILSAKFGIILLGSVEPQSMTNLKSHDLSEAETWGTHLQRASGINHPVSFIRYSRQTNGVWRQVVIYENKMLDKQGGPKCILYRLEFDVERLQHSTDEEMLNNHGAGNDNITGTVHPSKKPDNK